MDLGLKKKDAKKASHKERLSDRRQKNIILNKALHS